MTVDSAPNWWPRTLSGQPSAVGSAEGCQYAYFADSDRLAIRKRGQTEVYDTAGHAIRGVTQTSDSHGERVIHDAAGQVLVLHRFKRLS